MQNMFGEEIPPAKFTFEFQYPHMNVFMNGKYFARVSPNGWQGDNFNLHYRLGEPIVSNLPQYSDTNLQVFSDMLSEYTKGMSGRHMIVVIGAIARRKGITLKATAEMVVEKGIACYADPTKIDWTQYE